MPLAEYNDSLVNDSPSAAAKCAGSSRLFVLNRNAEATNREDTVNIHDPWAIAAGTGKNHANVAIIDVPGEYNWLNVFHLWRSNLTVSTPPQVIIYGLLPDGGIESQSLFPEYVDAGFPPLDGKFWVPLGTIEDGSSAPSAITLNGHVWGYAPASDEMRVEGGPRVYLQGAKKVMALVDVISVLADTGGGTSSTSFSDGYYSMVAGHFSS